MQWNGIKWNDMARYFMSCHVLSCRVVICFCKIMVFYVMDVYWCWFWNCLFAFWCMSAIDLDLCGAKGCGDWHFAGAGGKGGQYLGFTDWHVIAKKINKTMQVIMGWDHPVVGQIFFLWYQSWVSTLPENSSAWHWSDRVLWPTISKMGCLTIQSPC